MLNAYCLYDLSDEDARYCGKRGYITECPHKCEHFCKWYVTVEEFRKMMEDGLADE